MLTFGENKEENSGNGLPFAYLINSCVGSRLNSIDFPTVIAFVLTGFTCWSTENQHPGFELRSPIAAHSLETYRGGSTPFVKLA